MSSVILLVAGVFASLAIVFGYDALRVESISDAVDATANRVVGVLTGATATLGVGLAVGIEQLPELVIGLLGVGSLIAGIEWEIYLVGALLLWMISETISMRRAA